MHRESLGIRDVQGFGFMYYTFRWSFDDTSYLALSGLWGERRLWAVSKVGASVCACPTFRGLSCWWASVRFACAGSCGGGGSWLAWGWPFLAWGWLFLACGEGGRLCVPGFMLLVGFGGALLVVSVLGIVCDCYWGPLLPKSRARRASAAFRGLSCR